LTQLRRDVLDANLALARGGLVSGTFGNVSGVDRERGVVAIKPSGVPYEKLTAAKIVLVSLADGKIVGGTLQPSSDLATHLDLYGAFPTIGGVAHTHSPHATAFAQARRAIPALGTTHADYFFGPIPCTRRMRPAEIARDYEPNTGRVIVERIQPIGPANMPAVLVANHGPFAWGATAAEAVEHAAMLEYVASLASLTLRICPGSPTLADPQLVKKHFSRKHGPDAYYGQRR
ncbi:MAG: L-ribulose-5-phosphate 4-epimerase AraD, partial [Phycisphaerae bacterium]|nr:L-ribulose-5-phosphate 4-epimerase AraD [Phycisphaerae bacterium]